MKKLDKNQIIFSVKTFIGACAVILCLLQDSKQQQNMTAAITGGANDSFYEKNEGRTKEAIFRKITRVLLIALFVLTIAVNAVIAFVK